MGNARNTRKLIEGMDAWHVRACHAERRMLRHIAAVDDSEAWKECGDEACGAECSGAKDMAHYLGIRYGFSRWKAERLITAAHALESLPHLAEALSSGRLGVDKVMELARFTTPGEERALVDWAQNVPGGRIREEGDLRAKRSKGDAADIVRERSVRWRYHDEGRRFALSADYPAAEGAVLARAIDLARADLPELPEDDPAITCPETVDESRGNGLLALASDRLAEETDSERATVVIHVRADPVARGEGSRIEDGGIAGPETVDRLLCHARVQAVLEDEGGSAVRMTTMAHDPTPAMMRQLRYRDVGCRFPGCGSKRYSIAHHIAWWGVGGRTELGNLVLVCRWHHDLVHDFGWSLTRRADGDVRWYRPDGRRFRAGPAPPPRDGPDRQLVVA